MQVFIITHHERIVVLPMT